MDQIYVGPNTKWRKLPGWTVTNVWLASVTGAQTRMQGKRELTISINCVVVDQEVWLVDIVELLILGLDKLC